MKKKKSFWLQDAGAQKKKGVLPCAQRKAQVTRHFIKRGREGEPAKPTRRGKTVGWGEVEISKKKGLGRETEGKHSYNIGEERGRGDGAKTSLGFPGRIFRKGDHLIQLIKKGESTSYSQEKKDIHLGKIFLYSEQVWKKGGKQDKERKTYP